MLLLYAARSVAETNKVSKSNNCPLRESGGVLVASGAGGRARLYGWTIRSSQKTWPVARFYRHFLVWGPCHKAGAACLGTPIFLKMKLND
jgi:hypothetical protein